ncbi:hypothetical protein [Pyrococcus sp.]|nr:hypothetical protein [Pyrococcus sp.]
MDFSILNKNNIPPWNRIFDFHLDTNYIEETSIQGIETILIGDREAIRRALYLLDNLIPTILRKPRKIYTFFNEIYLKYGENQFIGLKIMGSMLTFRSHGIPLSQLPKILGRGIFVLNSLFYSKNAEFYRLLFVTSLETFGYFYEFFMKHIYPKLPLEHREFLEEMHDYKNFLQLLYFHLSRMSVDKIRDEVGILIRRRSRPDRPIELGIIFRDRGIEVRDRISTAHIDLLV